MKFPLPHLKKECFSYKELIAIPIVESGEPLHDLSSFDYKAKKLFSGEPPVKLLEFISKGMWTREGVALKLVEAQEKLSEIYKDLHLHISYAYRHPEVQRRYFADFFARITTEHPDWSDDQKREYAHHYMAIPEVGGHPAGAAIDLFLIDSKKRSIDMGAKIGDLSDLELVPPVSSRILEAQQQNRLLLRHVMTAAGFAPYDFEWWHFSFGDREWACYYQKPEAIYGEIDFRI